MYVYISALSLSLSLCPSALLDFFSKKNKQIQTKRISKLSLCILDFEEMDGVDQEQVSITVDDYEFPNSNSDPDSSSSSPPRLEFLTRDRMVKLVEGNPEHESIKKGFLGGMGNLATDISVVAIHRNSHSSVEGLARLEAFRVFSEAMRTKCGGNANIKRAWYGAGKDEICGIINNGFYGCREAENDNNGLHLHGRGVYLSPAKRSINGALWSAEDENGMRHILLCNVILGNMEVVCRGSRQFQPSSMKFDSGVDHISAPTRYIIWCAYMNSHILPKYIISIIPSSRALPRYRASRSNTSTRISRLLRVLPLEKVLIDKCYRDFQQNRITREQLVKFINQITGLKRLDSWIKFCTKKRNIGQD